MYQSFTIEKNVGRKTASNLPTVSNLPKEYLAEFYLALPTLPLALLQCGQMTKYPTDGLGSLGMGLVLTLEVATIGKFTF